MNTGGVFDNYIGRRFGRKAKPMFFHSRKLTNT
jgi:hypothetical protein